MNPREKNIAAAPHRSRPFAASASVAFLPASLTMLQMLGNPLASLQLEGALYFDLLQFAWLHSAPLPQVRALVVAEPTSPGTVANAVLEWAESLPPNFLAELATEIATDFERTSAAMAVSSEPSKSKNMSGRSSV